MSLLGQRSDHLQRADHLAPYPREQQAGERVWGLWKVGHSDEANL